MKLPNEVKQVRDEFISKFPYPQNGSPGDEFEGVFRNWFGKLIQQICFSVPNKGYGWKSADAGRPPSKDALAQRIQGPNGAALQCWDMFLGVGTGRPTLVNDPDSIDITGQNFISMQGINHLAGIEVPENDDDDDVPDDDVPTDDADLVLLMKIVGKLDELIEETKSQTLMLQAGLVQLRADISKGIKIRF